MKIQDKGPAPLFQNIPSRTEEKYTQRILNIIMINTKNLKDEYPMRLFLFKLSPTEAL